ncbi:site-specific integrase [Castellaniella sp.]|uniref:site-specific integrase n=1 Tax=Castellaniella sp. TaxID=1955812 RepID=UPI002AFF91BA|nr:site-specific integrase [Castellaniella sp.]
MKIDLKGINKVKDRHGQVRYYAWRGKGAPRLSGEPGSPEFISSYTSAIAGLRPSDNGSISSLIMRYRESAEWKDSTERTKKERIRWLSIINEYFGELPVAAFDRSDRIKPIIRKWRDQRRDTPRSADYGIQVLSVLLSFAVNEGKLASNPCFGLKALYNKDRAEIIWTDSDIAQMKAGSPLWLARMIDLAATSGLRLGDLVRLAWSHIGEHEIEIRTNKSRQRIAVLIPIYADLAAVLKAIPRRAPLVLTYDATHRPVTPEGFNTAWHRAWQKAGMGDRDLHFNDLRGTAVTRFYLAGLTVREIAEIAGWTEESVNRIIRRYVGRSAAVKTRIAQIDQTRKGTDFAK